MLIDSNTISSFSSDLLVPLSSSECAHLTSFDPIPSTPPPTVSLGVETSYYLQALQDNYEDVRHDAVTQCLVADTGKEQEWEHCPTPRSPVARTKDSSSTSKAALDVRIIAFDVARKFPIDDCDKSCEDSFICCETTVSITNISWPPHIILDDYVFRIKTSTTRITCRLRKVTIHLPALVMRSCPAGKLVVSFPIMGV
ncbi:hypothetical protein F5879DRAFT_944807, partial [Lentinula edodes]